MELLGVVLGLSGKPLPSQETVLGGVKLQPPILRLVALTSGFLPRRKPACTSAMASGMLLAQSPVPENVQLPASGSGTVDQVASEPVLPTV